MREKISNKLGDVLEREFIDPLSFVNSKQSNFISDIQEEHLAQVKLTSLLRGQQALCPIYFKLSSDSYLRFLDKGDLINTEDIMELLHKGVHKFYVEKSRIQRSDKPLLSICSLSPESS